MKTDDWFSPTRYRGQCIYCRREVPPGQGDYRPAGRGRWEVRHAGGVCPSGPIKASELPQPKKSTTAWSMEQVREEAERQGREVVSEEVIKWDHRIKSTFTASGKRAPDMSTAPKRGSIFYIDDNPYMVADVSKPSWVSRDMLEDMDDYTSRPGWYVELSLVKVSEVVADLERLEAKKAERRAKEEAEKEAERKIQEANRRWNEITSPPEGWVMVEGAPEPFIPPRETWVLEDQVRETTEGGYLFRYAERYRAGPYIVLRYGSWDNDRIASMIPPELVDEYKRAEAERRGVTSAKEETAKAEEGFEAKWKGIMTPPEGWSAIDITGRVMLPEGAEWIQIDTLEQRDENGQIVRYAYMYIVRPYLVVRHGTPGNDRVTIMIPPDLVEEYMRALEEGK